MRSVGVAPIRRVGSLAVAAGIGVLAFVVPACGGGGQAPSRALGGQSSVTSGGASGAVSGAVGGTGLGGSGPGTSGAPASGGAPVSGVGGSTEMMGGSAAVTGGVSAGGASPGGVTGTSGGASPTSGAGGGGGMPACQMASYSFAPKTPTVILLVDRSGSMFDCISQPNLQPSCPTKTDTPWDKVRVALESVVESLQGEVRFGFATITGTDPTAGGKCPTMDQVKPDLNNATPIKTLYDSLPFQEETNQPGKKFESPASLALQTVGKTLAEDTFDGPKYVLFATDGQPDYCDDSNVICAPDSVVGALQTLKTQNITTIVMGLQVGADAIAVPAGVLQAYANAGAGEPTRVPVEGAQDEFALWDQCNGLAPWSADLTATGKARERGATVGTYSPAAGPTKPYSPNVTDQAMLTSQLSAALAGVKSCSFDLGNVNGQSIKVDLNQLAEASVSIAGTKLAQDMTNGWSMASATQLLLNGTACETWRSPNNNDISFNFPCKTIIFE